MSKVNTLEEKFCDVDGSTELLADICLDKKNQNIKSVVIDDKFLIANSNNNLFISAFAYTLSCFTGDKDCVFLLVENNAEKLVQYPFKSNCQFKDNDEFLKQNGDYYDHIKGVDTSEISQILTKLNFEGASAIGIEDLAQSGNKQCQYKLDGHSLLLKVLNQNNRIELQLEYANSYSDKTMTNFLYSYQRFLEALCNNDDITQVSYITDEDLEFLNKFNRTQTKLQYTDVLEAYNYNIKNKPDNICVCCKDKKITYAQSSLLVAELAEELKSNGVDIDTKVAIYVPRSIWYMIAPLAILSVGATYVPLDNEYPKDRIEHMLSDTKAKMILTTEESHNECLRLKEQIKNFPKIINLSNFENIKVEDSYKGREIDYEKVGLDHTACILYTSGSTGVPKGSPTSRLALLNLSEWYSNYTNMTSDDIYGMYTAFVFDMHAMALWPTCVCGAALDVIPAEKRTNMNALASYINDHEITHTFITTQVAKIFAEGVKDSNLKVLFAAGEALRNVVKLGNYKMYDGYGPCENLALSTAINIDDRIDSTSVGWPFNNVKTYILDSNRRRVPVGAVGELYLSGYQLSSGYLNRDKETKAAFFDNPFDGKESGFKTMYKTGDIVRCLPDGSIGFVGRKDSQVKIRGNRVELTEVEDVIKKFDCIDNVTVQTVKNGNDNELVAYVVLTNNSRALDLASDKSAIFHKITQFVADKKPDYMVPSYVVVLDKIPLNVNGKIDKSALPKPNVESNRKEYTAPRNDIEKSLVEAFSHVLGVEKIGIDDNYFELGGNSIMTIELMSFPIFDESNILFQDIYDNPTPRLLAECMQGKTDSNKFIDRGISDYDYSSINSYLNNNYNESVEAYKNNSIDTSINPSGDIIITGATGFLGVHVLKEFLDNYNGKAYCVIRDRKNLTAKQRLNILFEFYFSCLPDEKYKDRIEIIDTDINSEVAQDKLSAIKADTVINCAACVDYVKNYEFMYKANVETVKNLIDLCLRSNKKLIHVSTISVYGYGNPDKANYKIAENKLYFGQVFDDSYTATKFIAERTILEAIIDKSLDAKIIRLGNLIGRYNDGALQINLASNGFLKTFWAFSKLGLFCEEEVDKQIEFSPINNVADSILKIAKTNHNLCIWHSFDVNTISVRSVVNVLKSKGIKLNLVSSDKIIDYYLNNIDGKHKDAKLIALILYPLKYPQYDFFENNNMNPDHSYNVLQKLNFKWPQITEEYLKKLFEYAIGLGYFD